MLLVHGPARQLHVHCHCGVFSWKGDPHVQLSRVLLKQCKEPYNSSVYELLVYEALSYLCMQP